MRTALQSDLSWGQSLSLPSSCLPSPLHTHPHFAPWEQQSPCAYQGRSKRTLCVPTVPHLLGHCTVDILREPRGHQVDGGSTAEVPAKSCIVLQPIAGAILQEKRGGNKELVWKSMRETRSQCVDRALLICPLPMHRNPGLRWSLFPPPLQNSDHLPTVTICLQASFLAWVHP